MKKGLLGEKPLNLRRESSDFAEKNHTQCTFFLGINYDACLEFFKSVLECISKFELVPETDLSSVRWLARASVFRTFAKIKLWPKKS